MAVTVKKINLWRKWAANKPGVLADLLEPLAASGTNLRVVMGYGMGRTGRAVIELFPISGAKATRTASSLGLSASTIPCLLVEGDDRAGLGAAMARAIADTGVNVSFLIAETVGRRFSAVFGFENDADATAAAKAIKAAARSRKR